MERVPDETLQYKFLAHWNTYINLPTRYTLGMANIMKFLFEQLPKTKLPLAEIYKIKMSGWSCDPYGKITIYPEGNFDNSKMMQFSITRDKNK
jgi:hypothetical protein